MKKLILSLVSLVLVLSLVGIVNAIGVPHPLYVNVQNDVGVSPAAGDLNFEAWLTKDPSSILTESSPLENYGETIPGYISVNAGNFATAWVAGDVVHIEVEQTSTGYVGVGEFTLTNDNYQMFVGLDGIIIAPLPPPDTKADILLSNGVPGKGIANAPGLQKAPKNDNFAKGTANKK